MTNFEGIDYETLLMFRKFQYRLALEGKRATSKFTPKNLREESICKNYDDAQYTGDIASLFAGYTNGSYSFTGKGLIIVEGGNFVFRHQLEKDMRIVEENRNTLQIIVNAGPDVCVGGVDKKNFSKNCLELTALGILKRVECVVYGKKSNCYMITMFGKYFINVRNFPSYVNFDD